MSTYHSAPDVFDPVSNSDIGDEDDFNKNRLPAISGDEEITAIPHCRQGRKRKGNRYNRLAVGGSDSNVVRYVYEDDHSSSTDLHNSLSVPSSSSVLSGDRGIEMPLLSPQEQPTSTSFSLSPTTASNNMKQRGGGGHGVQQRRIVLKNGDCNVIPVNISERRRRYLQDIFTTLVDAQWRWTVFAFVMSFLLSWLTFGFFWWIMAYSHGDLLPENQFANSTWTPCITNIKGFISTFLYSLETQHSTGYGTRSPTEECFEAVMLLCAQSIVGVMIQAFMVGIMFAKMSRPKQRTQTLLFSKHCVICQRDGQLCLQFRIGDMRKKSHLINSIVRVYLARTHTTQEGEKLSPYLHKLAVTIDDCDSNVFMLWPMTVVHKIDAKSPLYTMSATDLLQERSFEIIVCLEGTAESTGQTTQARTSYIAPEVLWGHRFQPLVTFNKDKMSYEADYAIFHNTYLVDTPLCSALHLDIMLSQHVAVHSTAS